MNAIEKKNKKKTPLSPCKEKNKSVASLSHCPQQLLHHHHHHSSHISTRFLFLLETKQR